jgi:hypothetical protein
MTDRRDPAPDTDEAHGVHAATREDGAPQEDPAPGQPDLESWADKTDTGGEAT